MEALIGSLALLPIAWLFLLMNRTMTRVSSLEENTYKKSEVEKIIDLKLQPLVNAVDNNTKVNEKLVEAITDLRVAVARIADKG